MAKEILIANSEQIDREELQKIFQVTRYHLTFSERDEDPLLRIKLFKPDLIIAGTGPGEMSSLELCEAVKGNPETRQIPFVLISSTFTEITEKDQKRVRSDGVIYKPFMEDEILRVVDRLMGEEALMEKETKIPDKDLEWRTIPGIEKPVSKKEGLTLDAFGEVDEEIIDLVEVEEEAEAEPRMRINDFIGLGKEEPLGEISPLETWGKAGEEKPAEKDLFVFPEVKELQPEAIPPPLKKGASLKPAPEGEDLFEKIDMDAILQEVEQLKPSLEKEFAVEKGETLAQETLVGEKVDELFSGFDDFEAALRKDVKPAPASGELEPAFVDLPKEQIPEEIAEVASEEIAIEEAIEELSEEEFPASLLEELGEEEVSTVEEPKKMRPEVVRAEARAEAIEEIEEVKEKEIEEVRPPPMTEKLPEAEPPEISVQAPSSLAGMFDKQMEEALAKGMREMMGEVINKFVPEMTHHVIRQTFERIEKMVREVLPDLAEKAIQEEIKRLQKEEKN